jgi:hypothetical protein
MDIVMNIIMWNQKIYIATAELAVRHNIELLILLVFRAKLRRPQTSNLHPILRHYAGGVCLDCSMF